MISSHTLGVSPFFFVCVCEKKYIFCKEKRKKNKRIFGRLSEAAVMKSARCVSAGVINNPAARLGGDPVNFSVSERKKEGTYK